MHKNHHRLSEIYGEITRTDWDSNQEDLKATVYKTAFNAI